MLCITPRISQGRVSMNNATPKISTENLTTSYYSREGMIQLLENTPTIRDFDKDRDLAIINAIESKYSTSLGIKTTQNRLLITADKK